MMCTDCIWVQEGMDEVSKTPPNSPSAHSSPNLVKFDKFKSFGDKMIQELTRPKPSVDTKCGFESTPFSKRVQTTAFL